MVNSRESKPGELPSDSAVTFFAVGALPLKFKPSRFICNASVACWQAAAEKQDVPGSSVSDAVTVGGNGLFSPLPGCGAPRLAFLSSALRRVSPAKRPPAPKSRSRCSNSLRPQTSSPPAIARLLPSRSSSLAELETAKVRIASLVESTGCTCGKLARPLALEPQWMVRLAPVCGHP